MDTIPFPDTRSDRLAETAMDELAQWAEEKLEIGVSAMAVSYTHLTLPTIYSV